jgi:hypothetical protein
VNSEFDSKADDKIAVVNLPSMNMHILNFPSSCFSLVFMAFNLFNLFVLSACVHNFPSRRELKQPTTFIDACLIILACEIMLSDECRGFLSHQCLYEAWGAASAFGEFFCGEQGNNLINLSGVWEFRGDLSDLWRG